MGVSALYLLYVSLALRRSHAEYLQRLDLEDELRQQRDLFEQQSRRDGLTGLANRRRFSSALEDWAVDARTSGTPLSLLILDLDHFKAINDRHGHARGDDCLREFAARLQAAFASEEELVARLGGEEFGVLLRETSLQQAFTRAEAFRRRVGRRSDGYRRRRRPGIEREHRRGRVRADQPPTTPTACTTRPIPPCTRPRPRAATRCARCRRSTETQRRLPCCCQHR